MFKKDDLIKYGLNGICKVTDIITRDFGGGQIKYYVLTPLNEKDSTYFVPTENELLTSRMQHILSRDEVYALIDDSPSSVDWVDNDKQRADVFAKILSSKDRRDIISLIKTIKYKKAELQGLGKKLHVVDERALADAERLISEEFAASLGIKPKDVAGFITDILDNK